MKVIDFKKKVSEIPKIKDKKTQRLGRLISVLPKDDSEKGEKNPLILIEK